MRFLTRVTASIALAAVLSPLRAQVPDSARDDYGASRQAPAGPIPGMSQEEAAKFRAWYAEAMMAKGMMRGAAKSDEIKKEAGDLVETLHLPCAPKDSALVAVSAGADQKTFRAKTYEVACSNGVGYLLAWQAGGEPFAMSCFAADAAHRADPQQAGIVCALPDDSDVKATAASLLRQAGATCDLRDLRWLGRSEKTKFEYTEVACAGGAGYMLETALPGSSAAPQVITCREAALQGLPCRLTNSGVPVVTIQTFKDALRQHGVGCDDAKVRVIGRETVGKRDVIEFRCTQHPEGLVAFIPLGDTDRPFEAIDCPTAATRGVMCKLTGAN